MTKSERQDIINRVNWIHKNREKTKELQLQIVVLQKEIQKLSSETIDQTERLKQDMKGETELNIKIEGRYYTLIQNSAGVDIKEFFLQIDE